MWHTHNLSIWEIEAGELGVQGQLGVYSEIWSQKKKKIQKKNCSHLDNMTTSMKNGSLKYMINIESKPYALNLKDPCSSVSLALNASDKPPVLSFSTHIYAHHISYSLSKPHNQIPKTRATSVLPNQTQSRGKVKEWRTRTRFTMCYLRILLTWMERTPFWKWWSKLMYKHAQASLCLWSQQHACARGQWHMHES